jgi:septal ring factor EnvC (AmiA/AmiB activator)
LPESIRNAIVIAFIAVLMAMVGVGLLAWSRRPAVPPSRATQEVPLLFNDREGGVSDLNVKLRQMERRLGESQVLSQRLMEQLQAADGERERLTTRITGLEKEVRSVRRRLQDAEQRLPPRPRPAPAATDTATPPTAPSSPTTTDSLPSVPPP